MNLAGTTLKPEKGLFMKAVACMLTFIVCFSVLGGCAGRPDSAARSGSGVQVYGTVDTGIGYRSRSISRD